MKRYIKQTFAAALAIVGLTGCNEFLDKMPDNRATLDSEIKIEKILAGAYLDHELAIVQEHMSDNTDDFSDRVPNSNRWREDLFFWRDEQETPNESCSSYWNNCYIAISATNEALKAMETLPHSEHMDQLKGEALMSRAYHHFALGIIFCNAYSSADAEKQLGLPYMTEPETKLDPKYERGNLADFYKKIEADLVEGLKYVSDDYYKVPKYHFNRKAALAFACRFYLYTEQWDKAVEYANLVLGNDPKGLLRNHQALANMTQKADVISREYIAANQPCNLMLATAYSGLGIQYGAYTSYGRYNHGKNLSSTETLHANQLWGNDKNFYMTPKWYQGSTYNKVVFWKFPYLFEYTDLNAQIGYVHTVYTLFTADEVLLERAEALTMLGRYDEAAADLDMWMHNIARTETKLTPDVIKKFYTDIQYYSYEMPEDKAGVLSTLKKRLNPKFKIDVAGSMQESMLQCVLGFRRVETIHSGMRWQDIKRYGIEIPRRELDESASPVKRLDFLGKDDMRRAIQVPATVISAGFTPNPR